MSIENIGLNEDSHMGAYILGQDPKNYVIGYNNEKTHVYPAGLWSSDKNWNETQYEWLRKLNNFFMRTKKELYESYCNLRSCDMRDFLWIWNKIIFL